MTQFKGSESPWRLGEKRKGYQFIDSPNGNWLEFARVVTHIGRKECLRGKANALLISKAPELLEMLEEVKDYLGSDVRGKVEQLIKEATEL
jgi:hypothetical protein